MESWNLSALRELIKSKFSGDVSERANDLINAIDWKLLAEGQHLILAIEAFKPFFPDGKIDTIKAANLSFARSLEAGLFQRAISTREVNLVAAITTSHTIPEIICQLASLVVVKQPLDVHSVSFGKVLKLLTDDSLRKSLLLIYDSPEYKYISAFSNMTKHINLIKPTFHVQFDNPEYHGVIFREFEYKNEQYPSKKDLEIINDLRIISNMYVRAGMQINAALV